MALLDQAEKPGSLGFLKGDGTMGERMRAHDWSGSPLGGLSLWPQSLRTAVNIMLSSKQPMFIAWGPELTFLYNDAYAPILAKKHPAAVGRPFRAVWSEIWTDIAPLIDRALAGEATWAENLHLVMERNGFAEDTWYSFSYSPIRDEADRIAGMFCACIETTAQVLAKRRSAAEHESLFEMTRDLFGVATFEGFLKTINPAWSRTLGRPHEELTARPFAEIIHPDDMGVTADVIGQLLDGKPVHQFHVRLLKVDGDAVSFAWSAVPDPTPGSGIFYTVGRDISEDLHREETLRQSQKMEAIGQLTGGIAHDFNNLLQAVHGSLDLIRRKPGDADRVMRLAGNGLAATERGAKLTAQLLAFSRSQKLELRPTAVAPLIAGMKDMIARSIGPHILMKPIAIDDSLGVLIDPTQLEMALLNLAINARDAMSDGGELAIGAREIVLTDDQDLPPGRYVEIRVTDDGTGMPADIALRAFEPFFTTKGIGKGTGLGLSQVYGMTRQAGGAARIENRQPRGTSIVLLLRRVEPEDGPAQDDDQGEPAVDDRTRTVVVVDDDPDVRRFLADALAALGFIVHAAGDGASGLALMERVDPDLLLLDFAMPGMTGAELADRARLTRPDLPIIFATGYADTAAIDAAVGDAVLIKKPFRIAELEDVVRRTLR